MDEWLNALRNAIAGETPEKTGVVNGVMALATCSKHGRPRVRMVVCRGIDADGSLWFVSDARSAKNHQLIQSAHAEACFWLAKSRTQFRVRGKVKVLKPGHPRAAEIWKQLPPATRAMFTWPVPGERKTDSTESFSQAISADVPPVSTFECIALIPVRVERLDLTLIPHSRRVWKKSGQWAGFDVNP